MQEKDIFIEICRVYGNNECSFSSVTRWCKKFKSVNDSVKNATYAHRPKNAISPQILKKFDKKWIETDAMFTTMHIAKYVGISVD